MAAPSLSTESSRGEREQEQHDHHSQQQRGAKKIIVSSSLPSVKLLAALDSALHSSFAPSVTRTHNSGNVLKQKLLFILFTFFLLLRASMLIQITRKFTSFIHFFSLSLSHTLSHFLSLFPLSLSSLLC
jgi:hypothetical protein